VHVQARFFRTNAERVRTLANADWAVVVLGGRAPDDALTAPRALCPTAWRPCAVALQRQLADITGDAHVQPARFASNTQHHYALGAPLRSSHRPGALVALGSEAPRTWSVDDHDLLQLARDLVEAVLAYPAIFATLPAAVTALSADALLAGLTDAQRADVENVVDLLERFRRQSWVQDQWKAVGRDAARAKVARWVAAGEPVRLVLPAFPMKSPPCADKVLGPLPDTGEVLALLTLDGFARKVERVYAPGCRVLIVSDGRVFNDFFGIADDTVTEYTHALRRLAPVGGHLQFIGLDELFASMTHAGKRHGVVALGARDLPAVTAKLASDVHFRNVYVAFKRLLMRDLGEPRPLAALHAKQMMVRNDCYSDLVRLLFPNHLRLSIHDHSGADKIGVYLIGRCMITPWHGVALRHRDKSWSILRKHIVEAAGLPRRDLLDPDNEDRYADPELTAQMCALAHQGGLTSLPYFQE